MSAEEIKVPMDLIYGTDPTEDQLKQIEAVKEELEKTEVFKNNEELARPFLTETVYHRFLASRDYDFKKSLERLENHLIWRFETWKVHLLRSSDVKDFNENGCLQVSPRGNDKHGRPIILMDRRKMKNKLKGKDKYNEDLTLVAYTLELATKYFTEQGRRYVVMIDTSKFSLYGNPPLSVQKKVIDMLSVQFPESLGLGIIYGAPYIFGKFYNMIKVFIDENTKRKILFLPKNVKEGSSLDKKMSAFVGDNWRNLLGINLEPLTKEGARGYNHEEYWKQVEDLEQQLDQT